MQLQDVLLLVERVGEGVRFAVVERQVFGRDARGTELDQHALIGFVGKKGLETQQTHTLETSSSKGEI